MLKRSGANNHQLFWKCNARNIAFVFKHTIRNNLNTIINRGRFSAISCNEQVKKWFVFYPQKRKPATPVNPPKKAEDDVKASNKAETKTDATNTEEGSGEVSAENEQTVEVKAEEKAPETAAVKPNKQNKSKNKKK